MEIFESYKEAHRVLKIKGSYQRGTQGNQEEGITSVKLTENPKSLDRISVDFQTIYYVGLGKKSSQGDPALNQVREDQEPFFVSLRTQRSFPVLVKLKPGVVLYPGEYRVSAIRTKQSPKDILYYQIELQRAHN